MNAQKIPQTDSIEELARFWDTYELTDFEDDLEEVTEPVFVRGAEARMQIYPQLDEAEAVAHIAKSKGTTSANLIREWVRERIQP